MVSKQASDYWKSSTIRWGARQFWLHFLYIPDLVVVLGSCTKTSKCRKITFFENEWFCHAKDIDSIKSTSNTHLKSKVYKIAVQRMNVRDIKIMVSNKNVEIEIKNAVITCKLGFEHLYFWCGLNTLKYFLQLKMLLWGGFLSTLHYFFLWIAQFLNFRKEIYKTWGFQKMYHLRLNIA